MKLSAHLRTIRDRDFGGDSEATARAIGIPTSTFYRMLGGTHDANNTARAWEYVLKQARPTPYPLGRR